MSLASFKYKLQPEIRLDDRDWRYTAPLPSPDKLDQARLVKTISLFLGDGKKQGIELTLVRAEENRAIRADPLHKFLVVSLAEFRAPRRTSNQAEAATQATAKPLHPSTPRECVEYATRLLRAGITLQGITYHFFGHSNSQLKSRTCFLFAGTKEEISAKVEALGDLGKLKTVAKKAKRIGLLFSTARAALTINPDRVEDIPDIEKDDYVFTDGCGLVAPRLAQDLARRTGIVFRDKRYTPSVFQIRYRGYKGVVAVDPTMRDGKVLLRMRKSMKKFSGGDDLSFAVVEHSKPYAYGYLNDEVVVLLNALGVGVDVLRRKQQEHFDFLEEASRDAGAAFRFLSYVNMPGLAERVLIEDELGPVQARTNSLVKGEYTKMLNKRDEQRCRILVPKSRLLFGIADAWGVLKEGECAVKVTLVGDGQPAALKSMDVLVTRNPCLHPGDLQKFRVVEKPELAHLVDCIVFSTQGRRPAADLMSGGDLDGDTFFVCWDSDLIPSTVAQPAQYPGVKEPIKFKPITDDDRLVFFAGYNNASLGRVKNLYLSWARVVGPMAPECQELNRLFSQCVDGNRIRVPPRLEKPPTPKSGAPPFILDALHDEAKQLVYRNTARARGNTLEDFEFDALELLLNRDNVAMSEFELIAMTQRWCRQNDAHLEDFLDFFDLNVLTAEEKEWVLQQIPPTQEIPAAVLNAVSYSNLLTKDAASRFQLNYHSIHWKCVYDSLSRDRLGTLLDTISKVMDTFHRKLILLRVDERLVVAIYVPRKIEAANDCLVDDTVRVFAFPNTQGTETQSRVSLPTKMTYRLYCDERTFQLFQDQRANTWIYLGRAPSDDSSYRSIKNAGDRRRQRHATVEAGTNFDVQVSIALDKFSRNLQRHVGRVNRNAVSAAEIYIISNRDVKSMRNLDLWLQHIDTDTMMPLFEQEADDYRVPSLADVDWDAEPVFVNEIVRRGNLGFLWELTEPKLFVELFSWLQERDQKSLLLKCYDTILAGIGNPGVRQSTQLDLKDLLWALLEFLQRAPYLAICFGRMVPIERVGADSETLSDTLEVHAFEVLRAFVLSANDTQELAIAPLKTYLSRVRGLTLYAYANLVELVSLAVRKAEVAMDILLECLEAESTRLLPGRPALVRHFVANLIGIALDHIEEASEQSKTWKALLRLKRLAKDRDGYPVAEITIRIDSESGRLENAAHVRLTAASTPINTPLAKRYSIDGLVIHSEQGLARVQCLHPLPPYLDQCQWKLTYCGPFTTSKTMFDAVRAFATQTDDCCEISSEILGLDSGREATSVTHPAYRPLEKLNPSQNAAVAASLASSLVCLWGPPGTGKTETIVSIIHALQTAFPTQRILVTAPTHNAVDNVLRRYLTLSRQFSLPSVSPPLRVSTEVRKVAEDLRSYTIDALAGGEGQIHLNRSALDQARKRIRAASIVFTTCIGSGIGLLRGEEFPLVIVDEASQQTEPASLVPLVKGCVRAVLVGDHVQLRPTVGRLAGAVGFDRSLFERVFTSPGKTGKLMLDTQYRMHEGICAFSSREFYQGRLRTGISAAERPLVKSLFPWPGGGTEWEGGGGEDRRMVFVECPVREEVGQKSKTNEGQAKVCLEVCKLLGNGDGEGQEQIAVLTPYAKQAEMLKRMMGSLASKTVTYEVSSIDGYQGREADVVVFVTVRCNESHEIGFLKDLRRMNVALTRARKGVIVIGNRETLTKSEGDEESAGLWRRLVASLSEVKIVTDEGASMR